jgi:hypothetical protein
MLVDFRHGGTLQQKVLHLVFENAAVLADLGIVQGKWFVRIVGFGKS